MFTVVNFLLLSEDAKSIEDISKYKFFFLTWNKVLNVYVQLQEFKKYEDALILNLIYSLWANPETIVLITYGLKHKEGNLEYFDTLQSTLVQTKLSQNLIWDIMFSEICHQRKKI